MRTFIDAIEREQIAYIEKLNSGTDSSMPTGKRFKARATTEAIKRIKTLLIKFDITQTDIADQLGVSRTAVSNVIKGIVESRRIKNAIASAVGKKLEELWPSENRNRRAA